MYIREAITIVGIMSISIMPKSFLVPLGRGGRFFRYSCFQENLSERVTFELNDKKENSKQGGDTHIVVLGHE